MTWARLDDGLWRNEKVSGCPDVALGLHLRAISYCADQETDGVLIPAALVMLRAKPAQIKALVDAGLWDKTGRNYQIHDFLEYNPSKQQLQQERSRKKAAGQAGGRASAQARAGRLLAEGLNPVPDPVPDPDPDPVPDPTAAAAGRAREPWLSVYENVFGPLPPGIFEEVEEYSRLAPEGWFAEAFEETLEGGGRSWTYTRAILDRWLAQGRSQERAVRGKTPEEIEADLAAMRQRTTYTGARP